MFRGLNVLKNIPHQSFRFQTTKTLSNATTRTLDSSLTRFLSSTKNSTPADLLSKVTSGKVPWGAAFADKMLIRHWSADKGWQQPQIVPYGPLQLSPASSVLHYGIEVFEGMKAFRGVQEDDIRLFRPYLNAERLNISADRIALPEQSLSDFVQGLELLLNSIRDWVPSTPASLYLRPCIIGLDSRLGVREPTEALFYVIASPVGPYFPSGDNQKLHKGIRLLADTKHVRAWPGGVGFCKTGGNYAISMAPVRNAREKGFDQVLWLSDPVKQHATEAGVMNIFFILENNGKKTVVTPRLDGTILDGVMRRSAIQLLQEKGLHMEERDISMMELFERHRQGELSEIFTTGTGANICPVRELTCENESIQLRELETSQCISKILRDSLESIQTGNSDHSWVHSIDEPENVSQATGLDHMK